MDAAARTDRTDVGSGVAFRRIVVGYDDSRAGDDAIVLGQAIAGGVAEEMLVAGVLPDDAGRRLASEAFASAVSELEDELQETVDRAAERIGARGRVIGSSSPARGLHDLAEEIGADLVVLGSRGRDGYVRVGRVATHLLHGAPCAVALAPAGYERQNDAIRVIGVAIDGSEESLQALKAAISIGLRNRATLRLMTVAASPVNGNWGFGSWGYGSAELDKVAVDTGRAHLSRALEEVPAELSPSAKVLTGDIAEELCGEAAKDVDLLCLGSRGYGPLRRVLLGSVSTELVQRAPCPVLVMPRI